MKEKILYIADKFIDTLVLPSDPLSPLWNKENIIFQKKTKWNYADNCVIAALLMMYEKNKNRKNLDYSIKYIDSYVDCNGNILSLCFDEYNLDNVCGGRNLLKLFKITENEKYFIAADRIYREQIAFQPRLKCGNFWHKAIYPNQVWLDGTYMAFPFIAEYALITKKYELLEDICKQLENIRFLMRDPVSGLYYHGFDESKTSLWADKITGLSPEIWLRSNGWICAALVDLAEIYPECQLITDMLCELLESLGNCISSDGMLFQLPCRDKIAENYPETSGALLFAYSAIKAFNLGLCNYNIYQSGVKILETVTEKYITFDTNELPHLQNICLMAGLGNNRNGSINYYLSERIVENDAKGIAPFLMAANALA